MKYLSSIILITIAAASLHAAPYDYSERTGWYVHLGTNAVIPAGTDFDQTVNGGAKNQRRPQPRDYFRDYTRPRLHVQKMAS